MAKGHENDDGDVARLKKSCYIAGHPAGRANNKTTPKRAQAQTATNPNNNHQPNNPHPHNNTTTTTTGTTPGQPGQPPQPQGSQTKYSYAV